MASYSASGEVVPTGEIDGKNCVFTLPQAPVPVTSLQLYKNGLLLAQASSFDRSGLTPYTLSGTTITLKSAPQTGDRLVAFYTYSSSGTQTTTTSAKASLVDLTTVDIVKAWLNTSGTASKTNAIEDANIQRCITAASRYWLHMCARGMANWQATEHSPFNEVVQFSESYDGNGNDQLFVRNWPIMSIVSLKINGREVSSFESGNPFGYSISDGGDSLVFPNSGRNSFYRSRGASGVFARGRSNVAVVYNAGFQAQAVSGEVQTIPTSSPYELQALELPWIADVGIAYFADGTALTAVNNDPAQGEYYVEGSGKYLFNAADAGQQVMLNYQAAGTPEDMRLAATQMVALNYKRRQWIDQSSQAMASGAGTVSYRSWEIPPEVKTVIDFYSRQHI